MRTKVLAIVLVVSLASCSILRQTPKNDLANGIYHSKVSGKVYVDNEGTEIHMYPLTKDKIDTSVLKMLTYSENRFSAPQPRAVLLQNSFDVDFLTIPFKYRFPAEGFPRQFTANLNGAIYLGYRTDFYVIHYAKNPLGSSYRNITHFGFSFGGFTGFGGTAMNPWVTLNSINIEYDGVVWSKGISGIIGWNRFTAGLALGWDNLLDKNKSVWIYQGKPWIGFAFGLNLN